MNNIRTTGFAAPTQGYEENWIDLNRLLVRNPSCTHYMWLDISDMEHLGLPKGTLLIVDRSVKPTPNHIVLFCHEGHYLCHLMIKSNKRLFHKRQGKPIPNPR